MASYRSNFGDLLEPGFREIYDDAYAEEPTVYERIFHVNSSDKQDEKDSGVTGFSQLKQTDEGASVIYEDPVQMYDVTFTHKKYTLGFKVSEELVEDDQYNVIKGKPAQLGRATRRTAETIAANVLNRAFNSSYVGGDADELCATGHARSDGGASQSNASATGVTLTDENLETARIAFRQQLDDKGQIIATMPDRLIVPVDLEKDAKILVGSNLRPGSADNDINVYKGTLEVIPWEYVTVNNTLWFLQDASQHKLNYFWRVKPEFKQDVAFDTGMALFKTRMRCSVGWSDWRGFWGSLGDGAAYSG